MGIAPDKIWVKTEGAGNYRFLVNGAWDNKPIAIIDGGTEYVRRDIMDEKVRDILARHNKDII
jgi:hypothetical protein